MKKKIAILLLSVIWAGSLLGQIKDQIGTIYYEQNNSIYAIYSNVDNTVIGQKGLEYREGKTSDDIAKVFGTVYYPDNNTIYVIYADSKGTLIGQKGLEYREGKETK